MPYKQFLGYNKGIEGNPVLVESEARIIRLIYRLFLLGDLPTVIARKLSNAGIPTPAGLPVWQHQTIESILRNEKYYGAALLQMPFSDELWNTVVDHVTVYADERLVFRFKNGSEVLVEL